MSCKITARIELLTNRIAADTAELGEAQARLAAAALVADVGAGFIVSFKVGRAETRREVEGVVLGRGEVKGNDSVRVQSGEGFDIELHTVKVVDLLSVKAPAEASPAAAGNADEDILNSVLG